MTTPLPAGASLAGITIADTAKLLRDGSLLAADLVESAITSAELLDERIGVYLRRFDEQARRSAREADRELAAGLDRGPLHGIPIAVKDLITTREGPTTAQSRCLEESSTLPIDAGVVSRLRAAGAIITGKTTLSEVAIGPPDLDSPFPTPRNPWDLHRWAGGSSGGSGSAVATGMALAAIGTDTGGSVRIPAAFCGVTGLKPTTGLLPSTGCIPLARSFDTPGPLARSSEDCALLLQAMAKPDLVAAPAARRELGGPNPLHGLRIGVDALVRHTTRADSALVERFTAAIEQLAHLGAEIIERPLPAVESTREANQVVLMYEAFDYHRSALRERPHTYGAATRDLLNAGARYRVDDYEMAQRQIHDLAGPVNAVFEGIDVHISPTVTTTAPRLEELTEPDLSDLLGTFHTAYWSTHGQPALSLPIGAGSDGLPLAMQITARHRADLMAASVGTAYQDHTDWHRTPPPMV